MFLVVSIDSKGFKDYYELLSLDIGVSMTGVTKKLFNQHDRQRKTDQLYSAKPERMVLRAKRKLDNMQAEWKKEVTDKLGSHTYDSGMADRKEDLAMTASNTMPADKSKAKAFCPTANNVM